MRPCCHPEALGDAQGLSAGGAAHDPRLGRVARRPAVGCGGRIGHRFHPWREGYGQARTAAVDQTQATARTFGEPLALGQHPHLQFARPFRELHATDEEDRSADRPLPSRGALEELLAQLEESDLRADHLGASTFRAAEEEILHKGDANSLTVLINGVPRERAKRITGQPPKAERDVRERYKPMARCLNLAKLPNPRRPQFANLKLEGRERPWHGFAARQ